MTNFAALSKSFAATPEKSFSDDDFVNTSSSAASAYYYSTDAAHEVEINRGLPELNTDDGRSVSPFEFWPAWVFYTPVIVQCLWLGLRYRNLSLPLIANPSIALSGLVGESKHAVLNLAGDKARQWIAPYIVVQQQHAQQQIIDQQLQTIYTHLETAGLHFPLVAKPDIGCRGAGVRLLETDDHLRDYLHAFPTGHRFLLQKKAPYSAEAGVFYMRHPGAERGQIFSIALKYTPFVVGDGVSTLGELIEQDKRAGLVQHLYLPRHQHRLDKVIPAGKKFPLAFSGSHCRGSIFRNGNHLITDALTQQLDEITRDIPGFYYGRLDIKFKDVESLMAGEHLCIVEINGASSEAAHIWDRSTPLKDIFVTLLQQYRTLYAYGDYHRQQGHKTPSVRQLLRAWRKEKSLVVSYPTTD